MNFQIISFCLNYSASLLLEVLYLLASGLAICASSLIIKLSRAFYSSYFLQLWSLLLVNLTGKYVSIHLDFLCVVRAPCCCNSALERDYPAMVKLVLDYLGTEKLKQFSLRVRVCIFKIPSNPPSSIGFTYPRHMYSMT